MAFGVDDAVLAAAVTGGTQLLGSGANIYAQGRMNRKTRLWNEKMYGIQQVNNLRNWQMQNEYNSPEQQMTRLRQAGLNPHLVYGKGADNTAASINQAKPGDWSPKAPTVDLSGVGNAFSKYQEIKTIKLQQDNLAQAIAVNKAEEGLKKMQALNIAAQTDRTNYDLNFTRDMKDVIINEMVLKNKNIEEGIRTSEFSRDMKLQEFELAKLKNSADIAKTMQEIAASKVNVLRQQAELAMLPLQKEKLMKEIDMIQANVLSSDIDRKIKNIELDLRNKGIQPNDWIWFRKMWEGLTNWTTNDAGWTANYKRNTYGGRPGFDADGNRVTLFQQMSKGNYYK